MLLQKIVRLFRPRRSVDDLPVVHTIAMPSGFVHLEARIRRFNRQCGHYGFVVELFAVDIESDQGMEVGIAEENDLPIVRQLLLDAEAYIEGCHVRQRKELSMNQ